MSQTCHKAQYQSLAENGGKDMEAGNKSRTPPLPSRRFLVPSLLHVWHLKEILLC